MYSTDNGSYFILNRGFVTKQELSGIIGRNADRLNYFIHEGLVTPVYVTYVREGDYTKGNYRVKSVYTSGVESNTSISNVVIPVVYKVFKVHENYEAVKLSLAEIQYICSKYAYKGKKYHYSRNHTTHTAYTGGFPNTRRLLKFYTKALDTDGYLVRHQSRYTSYRKKYELVLDWDGVSHYRSSGWKSRKYRHQWEHNL